MTLMWNVIIDSWDYQLGSVWLGVKRSSPSWSLCDLSESIMGLICFWLFHLLNALGLCVFLFVFIPSEIKPVLIVVANFILTRMNFWKHYVSDSKWDEPMRLFNIGVKAEGIKWTFRSILHSLSFIPTQARKKKIIILDYFFSHFWFFLSPSLSLSQIRESAISVLCLLLVNSGSTASQLTYHSFFVKNCKEWPQSEFDVKAQIMPKNCFFCIWNPNDSYLISYVI